MSLNPTISRHLQAFLSGSGTHEVTPLQTHLLGGWKPTTLASYNSAVKRFLDFYGTRHRLPFLLPALEDDIYNFCLSVGRTVGGSPDNLVTAKTLMKYLYALQEWHLFHQKTLSVRLPRHHHGDAQVICTGGCLGTHQTFESGRHDPSCLGPIQRTQQKRPSRRGRSRLRNLCVLGDGTTSRTDLHLPDRTTRTFKLGLRRRRPATGE